MEKITHSVEETKKLAGKFAVELKRPAVVALYGDLGSGKTTFVQGLAVGLKIKQKILSPTFVLLRSYPFGNEEKLHHLDLYRLNGGSGTESLGLNELFNEKSGLVVIEWPEKIEKNLPKNTIRIKFEHLAGDSRRLIFS